MSEIWSEMYIGLHLKYPLFLSDFWWNLNCFDRFSKNTQISNFIVEEWKTNLMSLVILFQLLCAQHVSGINISIFRSLLLCWWITTSVVLFSVRCVLQFLLRLIFVGVRVAGWNKIVSDIRLVFHSSTIAMMHGPINIRSNFMKIRTMGVQVVPCGQTDGRTDITKLIVAFW